MITSIGLLELTAIAKGIEATDAMLKASDVTLVFARPVCPGKFIMMVHGDVGAVKQSVAVGVEVGSDRVVNHLVIPRVHAGLLPAISGTGAMTEVGALGVVEFFDITSAVIAADAAAKASQVDLLEVRLGMGIGGKSFFRLTGEVASVEAAVSAAISATADRAPVVSSCVIPAPDPALFKQLV